MKVKEVFDYLLKLGAAWEDGDLSRRTCDTVKAGSTDSEITSIGVSMFATPSVIRECTRKGINFLIVHEPTYYNHWDDHIPYAIGEEKRRLIEASGVTIVRFHDHAHAMQPDLIYEGEIKFLGLKGTLEQGSGFAINRFVLDEPMTARSLATLIQEKLKIKHVRIAGEADKPGRRLSCSFGTPGKTASELEECDFVLTGEICEWAEGQLARDYAQLGYGKAIIVMGHIGSERDGMRLLSEKLTQKYPDIKTEYIECGEVYSYAD